MLDLPNTRSGDAIRALITTVILVLFLGAKRVVFGGWPSSWFAYLFMGTFYGLWMFAWFRWLHRRPKASAQRMPPAA